VALYSASAAVRLTEGLKRGCRKTYVHMRSEGTTFGINSQNVNLQTWHLHGDRELKRHLARSVTTVVTVGGGWADINDKTTVDYYAACTDVTQKKRYARGPKLSCSRPIITACW